MLMHAGCSVLLVLCCQPFRRNICCNAQMWLTTVLMQLRRSGYLKRLQLAGQPAANGAGPSLGTASASAASAAHAQLLQTLGGHKGPAVAAPGPSGLAGSSIGPGGLAAPRAVRPQDSQASMQLADLAMALKKQVRQSGYARGTLQAGQTIMRQHEQDHAAVSRSSPAGAVHCPQRLLSVVVCLQAAAPLPGTSGASAFSQPGAGALGNDGGSSGGGGGGSSTPSRMRRQGSDGLRRGSSGSLPNGTRGTTGATPPALVSALRWDSASIGAGFDDVPRSERTRVSIIPLPCDEPVADTAGPATGRRTGKRTARDSLSSEALPFKKRMDLNRAAAIAATGDDDGSESAEEGAEMALVRMR